MVLLEEFTLMGNAETPEAPEISKAALKAYIPEPPAEEDNDGED